MANPWLRTLAAQVIDFAPKRAISALAVVQKESFVEAVWRALLRIPNGERRIGGGSKIRKLAKKCATLPWGWRSAALSLREKENFVVSIGG